MLTQVYFGRRLQRKRNVISINFFKQYRANFSAGTISRAYKAESTPNSDST